MILVRFSKFGPLSSVKILGIGNNLTEPLLSLSSRYFLYWGPSFFPFASTTNKARYFIPISSIIPRTVQADLPDMTVSITTVPPLGSNVSGRYSSNGGSGPKILPFDLLNQPASLVRFSPPRLPVRRIRKRATMDWRSVSGSNRKLSPRRPARRWKPRNARDCLR